jgi:hypothetical protein
VTDFDLYAPLIGNATSLEVLWALSWLISFLWTCMNIRQAREWAQDTRQAVTPNPVAVSLSGNSLFIQYCLGAFTGAMALVGMLAMLQPPSECPANLGAGGWLIVGLLVGSAVFFIFVTAGIRTRQAETRRQLEAQRGTRRMRRAEGV